MLRHAAVCVGFGSAVASAVAALDAIARWCMGV